MTKKVFLLSVLLTLSALLFAGPVDRERAKDVANLFLQKQVGVGGQNRAPQNLALSEVSMPQYEGKMFVFNTASGGFIVVSANDVAYPILGYSDVNKLNAESIPSNVKAWLDLYANEIRCAVDSGVVQTEEIRRMWANIETISDTTIVVEPLIATKWNQSPLYNNLCPYDSAENERAVTGCVATAMAQVLKYWDFPVVGNGDYSYKHTLGTQYADFGATTYDWTNMPLELTSASTAIQIAAVAQLMYHCGVSVEMDYGVSSSGAFTISSSSNTTHCAEYALREYWGYKPALKGLKKSSYTDKDWKQMIKDDLDAGRPIIYSGSGDGGHCFVCDGYNEEEYFHFNWGWGGLYDGFFKLNALAPGTGGTGSGGGTYNNDQQAIFGVEPLRSIDGDESEKDLHLASIISLPSSEIAYKEGFSVSASIKNGATEGFSGDLGLALYDSGLELLTIIDVQDTTISVGGTIDCTFGTEGWSELVAGLYYAAIYSKTADSEWKSIGGGSYRNMVQFRIGITDDCVDKVVYECDFESELIGWTFAKADGINTGFAVDTAMKYQGEKSLYISPDGGKSAGYTQDGDSGYVSVAYKKVYLEAGSYSRRWNYYSNLKYLDIDQDYVKVAIVPADNKVEALNYYEYNPSFLNNYLFNVSYSSNASWSSTSSSFSITTAGEYYLIIAFMATDEVVNEVGFAIDNIKLTKNKKLESFDLHYKETKQGVEFSWTDNSLEYSIYWYANCEDIRYRDTIVTDSYFIPFTKLRTSRGGYRDIYFEVKYDTKCGTKGSKSTYAYVYTSEFPKDTCILRPTIKAINTDSGVVVSWSGNSDLYDFKYGRDSYGCNWIDTINSVRDTSYLIPYNRKGGIEYEDCSTYFFVRAICENDTSIWNYTSICAKAPEAQNSQVCYAKPYDLYAQNIAEGIMLTWKGNANKYEIECRSEDEYYKRGNKYQYNDSNYVRFMANDSMYVIPYEVLSDTLYYFRVRAICENDTSFWTNYISAYNINFGEYCIPFYDLCGPNTLCTYGSYSDPYSNKKTLDYRQKDWRDSYYNSSSSNIEKGYRYGVYGNYGYNNTYYRSRHTICFEGEVDPRCDSLLTTVPPGEKYSMRLGNWYNGEGESVTYTHKIDSGHKLVLILKYAVVLQDPSHESRENPHFTLEILDENDQLLDSECLFADFAADKNATGWNVAVNAHEPTKEEFRNVVWKDWTTIGVNLSDLSKYGDRTIKIRLTTKDCTRGQHYGYAYFTLQCTTGNMFGIKCGERPIYFEVAEGFNYRWYLMDDTTKASVWDQRRFEVAAQDTNSYYVDMISLENENCFYTLKAYTLPRLPQSKIEYKHTPHDCLNEVSFFNKSDVIKIMLDGSFVLDYREVIEATIWDFGEYGTSLEENPKLIVPNEGDTFTIKLKTLANDCENIAEFLIEVPAIRDTMMYVSKNICEGDTLVCAGKEYYEKGIYLDTLKRSYGCDSILHITVDYIVPVEEHIADTISDNMLPYMFFEEECMATGEYTHIVPAMGGCDSVIYHLQLQVYDELVMELGELSEICGDAPDFVIPYVINQGMFINSELNFNKQALDAGFVNVVQRRKEENEIVVKLPDSVRPDKYSVDVNFYAYGGDTIILPLEFTVLYPSSVIGQRWNDFLSVKNSQHNGGYTFTDYQWYLNDEPIEGAKVTQIYEHGKELDFEGEYRVLLTREDDGKSIMSCAFTPIRYDENEYTELSTLVYSNQIVVANASSAASVVLYNVSGVKVASYEFAEGNNDVKMPSVSGVYTMLIMYENGDVQIVRLVVR